eukprot:gnl/TRDRNA2_/TRDRNA2_126117_c0_seq1.p1 gnl/TRDRNA2_/TRDRNA2_126117_c0~~gnl/TRDRNA2_/TRDRNA2_126117_c0_seq1.p1  ORF type:complete len:618 (+),score=95.43 gnl/TRDRNA2_/TRDRNA2_126117_c0_seq1:181-2034(+)
MAGIARWYGKWDSLDVDSDGEDVQHRLPVLDEATQEVLKTFPKDVAESVAREANPAKRDALLALNCYVCELQRIPRESPNVQQQLLSAVCQAARGLKEGGELETMLFKISDVLRHPRADPQHVEHAMGAMALMSPDMRDPRVLEVIIRSGVERIAAFSARCLARGSWSCASLLTNDTSDAAHAFLNTATALAEKRAPDFEANDVALFSWACVIGRPVAARDALRGILRSAKLPEADSQDARVTAWALECWGLNAAPYFGLPPTDTPADFARGLHQRFGSLVERRDANLVHSDEPRVLRVEGLLAPAEARALIEVASGRWQHSASGQSDLPRTDTVMLQSAAGLPIPVVERVRRRAAKLFGLPESHCEVPCVTRHVHGEQSSEQVDCLLENRFDRAMLYLGGQRIATVLIFLSAVPSDAGGEIVFPKIEAVAPAVLGQALVWLNIRPDGKPEERLLHTSAPLRSESGGAKYLLHLWLHVYPVQEAQNAKMEVDVEDGMSASGEQLPSLPTPERPKAPVEVTVPREPPIEMKRSWDELGEELQSLTASLDSISDSSVRHLALHRLRNSRQSVKSAEEAVAKGIHHAGRVAVTVPRAGHHAAVAAGPQAAAKIHTFEKID